MVPERAERPEVDVTVELPHSTRAPRAARALVAAHLGGEARCEEASLCISELVTNAVLHAGSAPLVRIVVARRVARVETRDDSPVPPVIRPHDPTSASGRGLRIVESLADRWGSEPDDRGGKVVWFELDLDRRPQRHRGDLQGAER